MGLRLHVGVTTQFLWTFQVMYPLSTPSFHTRKDRWDPIFLRRFIHPRLKRRPKNTPFFLKRNNHSKKHAKTHGLWMDWTTCKNSWFMNGLDPPSLKKNRHNPVSFFKKTTDLRWCMHHLGQIYLPIFRFKFESLQNIHKLSDELSLPRCQDLHELYLGNLDGYCWKNPWNTCIWHPAMC